MTKTLPIAKLPTHFCILCKKASRLRLPVQFLAEELDPGGYVRGTVAAHRDCYEAAKEAVS